MGYWVAGLATFAYPTLKKICGDGGYRGSFVYEVCKYFGLRVESLLGSIILVVFQRITN
ncbi:MAG: hypothetical protein IJK81_04930 [Selenomonadaceae bacterium]|nr:hypothetical protein [Selenomonadaceae bacterium]